VALGGKDVTQILAGGAEIFIGAKTADAAAGTLVSFGHTLSPTEFGFEFEDFPVETEQSIGRATSFIVGATYSLKLDIAQNSPAAMRIAARLPAAALTGTSPNENLAFIDPAGEFFQVAMVGKGYGTTKIDTYTFWNCQVRTVSPVPFGKKAVQHLGILLDIFRDDTVVTTPNTKGIYGRRVAA
jgi:hypothetical protein